MVYALLASLFYGLATVITRGVARQETSSLGAYFSATVGYALLGVVESLLMGGWHFAKGGTIHTPTVINAFFAATCGSVGYAFVLLAYRSTASPLSVSAVSGLDSLVGVVGLALVTRMVPGPKEALGIVLVIVGSKLLIFE